MFEWYDLRMIDLYPEDETLDGSPTAPAGVIGEPREEIAEDEGDLAPETIGAD
jgi:hypothetical protein